MDSAARLKLFQDRMRKERQQNGGSPLSSRERPASPFKKLDELLASSVKIKQMLESHAEDIASLMTFKATLKLPTMMAMPQQRTLNVPVETDQGGLGTDIRPTAGQVPVGTSKGTYAPGTVSVTPTVVSTTTTPLSASINQVILMNAAGGNKTVNLPAASVAGSGGTVVVKKVDSSGNTVTIDGSGAETIDGAATFVLSVQYESVTLVCDGSNWSII